MNGGIIKAGDGRYKRFIGRDILLPVKVHRRLPLKLILLACLAATLVVAYLRYGFLPEGLRDRALAALETSTGVRLDFRKALYLPFQGLILEGASVHVPAEGIRFRADRVVLDVRLSDLVRDKKIVIDTLRLDRPFYEWVLHPASAKPQPPPTMTRLTGQLAVPVVGEDAPVTLERAVSEGTGAFLPENVYLEQIEIRDGHVRVLETEGGRLVEDVRSIGLRIALDEPPVVSVEGSLVLGGNEAVTADLKGRWNLDASAYDLLLDVRGRRIPAWLSGPLRSGPVRLGEGPYLVRVRFKNGPEGAVVFRTQARLPQADAALDRLRLKGSVRLDVEGSYDTAALKLSAYRGSAALEDASLSGLADSVPTVDGLEGLVRFEPDRVWSDEVRARAGDVPLAARFSVQSFAQPVLDAEVRVDSDAERLLPLISEADRAWMKGAQISGRVEARSTFRGPLRVPGGLETHHDVSLSAGTIRVPDKQLVLTDASMRAQVNPGEILVREGLFKAGDLAYRIELDYPRKPGGTGSLRLTAPELDVRADYAPENNGFFIRSAAVRYHGLDAQLSGRIREFDRPRIDVNGRFQADLARLGAHAGTRFPALADAGLAGSASGAFNWSGPVDRPVDWTLAIDLDADPLVLRRRVRVGQFKMQLRQQGGVVQVPYFHGRPYGGTLGARFAFDLRRRPVTVESQFFANNVNLHDFLVDLDGKPKSLSGNFSLQGRTAGVLGKAESFTGTGSVDVRDGKLWETQLFKAMGQLPFVKVEGLDLTVFRNLAGTFLIRDKRLWSQDLTVTSDVVHLSLQGSAGFDQTLDFLMRIRYSPDILEGAKQAGGLVPFVVQEAEGFISVYKIGGTVSKPTFEKTSQKSGNVGSTLGNLIKTLAN